MTCFADGYISIFDSGMCVSVPVVKPSSLPMRTRAVDRPSIYTSPIVEGYSSELKPMLISAPRRMPGIQSQSSQMHGRLDCVYICQFAIGLFI